jgi:hypothetical protein
VTDPQPASARKQAKEAEDAARLAYYRTVPKKHYRELSGRQDKILNEQAKRHGLPIGGSVVDLFGVIKRFHDLLAEHAKAKHKEEPDSPALERFREERALLARLDRLEREGSLLPRDLVHTALGVFASTVRQGLEQIQRQFGRDAYQMMDEVLTDGQNAMLATIAAATSDADSHDLPDESPSTELD